MSSVSTRYGLMGYYGWSNLGDAAQTYCLSRLLPNADAVRFRDRLKHDGLEDEREWVLNGFFHRDWHEPGLKNGGVFIPNYDHNRKNLLYAGIHVGKSTGRFHGTSRIIGARDSFTERVLKADGIPVEWCGCATSTLEKYTGPRSGELYIEAPGRSDLTQEIPFQTPWQTQWDKMLARMDQLRTAERVITKRLHVVIPCLAFGTPVMVPWSAFYHMSDNARMTVLDDFGFEYDKFMEIDMTPFAERFKQFLYTNLGIDPIIPTEKACPQPV